MEMQLQFVSAASTIRVVGLHRNRDDPKGGASFLAEKKEAFSNACILSRLDGTDVDIVGTFDESSGVGAPVANEISRLRDEWSSETSKGE